MTDTRTEHKIAAAAEGKSLVHVTPERAGWHSLDFRVERHRAGATIEGETGGSELCLVFMSGDATVEAAGNSWSVQGRRDVFAGLPFAVYLPPGESYRIRADSDMEVAFAGAPADGLLPPRLIRPEDVKVEIRGGHNATRQISHILDPGAAEHLLCVEVYTPSGNWSSYPPHKHDVQAPPDEVDLEEIYHYRVQPHDGWALQRLYNDDRSLDEVVLAQHGDTVLVRQGYHPVVTAPGYDCYYLNFLAGETPSWIARDEPQLAWVRGSWEGAAERLRIPLEGTGR
ncbi:MAG: 5-deoxy-glucuronate isomerase [Trueperaceae bacterium]